VGTRLSLGEVNATLRRGEISLRYRYALLNAQVQYFLPGTVWLKVFSYKVSSLLVFLFLGFPLFSRATSRLLNGPITNYSHSLELLRFTPQNELARSLPLLKQPLYSQRSPTVPLLPPLNSRTSSPNPAPIYFLIAAAKDSPPHRSSTDMTGAPSPRSSTGHLVWSSSNSTPHRDSMSFLNSAPKLLWDRDKPGNLTPNDAYNLPSSLQFPHPPPKGEPLTPSSHHGSLEPPGRRSLSPISNAALHHMQRSSFL